MSRLTYLTAHPKRSLSALGTLMVAAGLTAGSGAFFQDEAASAGNSVKAGVLDVAMAGSVAPAADGNDCDGVNDPSPADCLEGSGGLQRNVTSTLGSDDGGAALEVTNLTPGSEQLRRGFAVCNKGTVPARIRLSVKRTSGSLALFDAMDLEIGRGPGAGEAPLIPGGDGVRYGWQDSGYQTVANTASNAFGTGSTPAEIVNEIADNDGNIDTPNRQPLEPGKCFQYEAAARLVETDTDQSSLMGKSVAFKITSIARSVNSAGA